MGQVNGGVWKSDDYGRTWNPIFDHESTQSIGAIAVAASDPNIIYVASGEGLHRPDLSVATEFIIERRPEKPGLISACAMASKSRTRRRSARSQSSFRRRARPSLWSK